jgi:hypothetical protein
MARVRARGRPASSASSGRPAASAERDARVAAQQLELDVPPLAVEGSLDEVQRACRGGRRGGFAQMAANSM